MNAKALIYCRVSSQRQVNEGNGLGSQEQRCRQYASSKNYQVVAVFPDEGISGGLFERPAMQKLIKYLDDHSDEDFVVIFDDLSRFARDVKVHIQLKAELVSRGVKLECLNFNFDESEEGELVELIMAATNQYNRKSNRRQVIQKQKARLEKGYWAFCMPRGLINKRDPIHGKILVRREPLATIYKEGIEKFRDGILPTIESFQTFVNEKYKEYHVDRHMSFYTATDTLKEILYAGWIEYLRWGVPRMKAQHEGFISIETYDIVQERLLGRSKPRRHDYSLDFPLRPYVLCAACNKPMTASWNTGRAGKKYPNYFCRVKGCTYNWKTVKKTKLESEFEALLFEVKPTNELIDLTRDVLQEQWDMRFEKYADARKKVKEEIYKLTTSMDAYLQRIGKTKSEELVETYEEEFTKLKRKKNDIEKELGKQHYTKEEFGTASEKVFNVLKNPVAMWKSEDYDDKRIIIGMYFEENLTYDYYKGFGTASLAYPLELITKNRPLRSGSVEMSSNELECERVY